MNLENQSVVLSSNIGQININNPFFNASGAWCQTKEQLNDLINSNSGGFISKSCTPQHREGNPPVRYWDNQKMSINSMGLPNLGISSYLNLHNDHSYDKPYFLSLAGLNINDNLLMSYNIVDSENIHCISGLEYNLSCPNIIGKGQLGYDFEATNEYLRRIMETPIYDINKSELAIGIKLPPYFELTHFDEISDIVRQFPRLDFMTCINSIANGLVIDTEKEAPVIYPKSGFGGIGGNIVKPTALANVRKFYTLLGDKLDIIGCGGVLNGEDAFHHILAGASAVSVGTSLMVNGPIIFDTLNSQLEDIMISKGYNSIGDFKGKLKGFY